MAKKKEGSSVLMAVSKILPDENQPRKYFDAKKMAVLRASIKRNGVLTPIIIEHIKEDEKGRFRIIDGERRFRAAVEEGLREIPYVILETDNESDRLMQQFQIQEMHENWSPVEKAYALERLAEEMGSTIQEVCSMLGLERSVTSRYVAFASMADKAAFVRNEVPIEYAKYVQSIKNHVRRIYNTILEQPFERADEKAIESAIFKRIKSQDIRRPSDMVKIKDSFTKNPEYIEKFLSTNVTPEAMFYETKAQGAFHLRNVMNNAHYLRNHIDRLFVSDSVPVSGDQISQLKDTQKKLKKLIDAADNA